MNIDDFLKRKQFQVLDEYLTSEMNRTAGEDLVSRMKDVFEAREEEVRDWYFSNIGALGGKRPYDVCKEGNSQEVEKILSRIEHGVYS